ncbi:MAG TPA: hypothetical protein PLB05_08935 [Candidatus Omnitrophota bacterium]|nr:hypothetical protein [Candidatus Omnitrophota bacterium]HPN56362.1 hypothetical protein [Candidatus Omnitrophota bacterium]
MAQLPQPMPVIYTAQATFLLRAVSADAKPPAISTPKKIHKFILWQMEKDIFIIPLRSFL